jgi:hypothetical protein
VRLYKKLYKLLGPAPKKLCNDLRFELSRINWDDKKYKRFEQALTAGRLIEMPYQLSSINVLTENDPLAHVTQLLINWINLQDNLEGFEPVRGEIATLLPGVKLQAHKDRRWFHTNSRRMHIPLMTNENCWHSGYILKWGEGIELSEKYHMPIDTLYELNNVDWHQAGNDGDIPRVHLIVDFMPKGFLAQRITEGKNPTSRVQENMFAEWVSDPEKT